VSAPAARRSRSLAVLAAALAIVAAGCAKEVAGSDRMTVSAPAWIWSGRPTEIRVETRGALAARRVSLLVSVNGNTVDTVPTEAGAATIEIAARHLRGGVNRIAVKTGTERVELNLRVMPIGLPATFLAAAVIGAGILYLRRRGE
jgi:hypothetical protein